MYHHQRQVKEFIEVMLQDKHLPVDGRPRIPDEETIKLGLKLILEEALELVEACGYKVSIRDKINSNLQAPVFTKFKKIGDDVVDQEMDIEEAADAMTDLQYVNDWFALACGLDLEPLSQEVHRANMTKLWEDGRPHFNEFGKVLKPPTFEKPNIRQILQDLGYGFHTVARLKLRTSPES